MSFFAQFGVIHLISYLSYHYPVRASGIIVKDSGMKIKLQVKLSILTYG